MAIHHPTPPLGGGERPRLPSVQVGPVTQAVRAMRSAEHAPRNSAQALPHGIRTLSRTEVEDLIGGLIDLLDAMDGDADAEDVDVELEDGHVAEGNTDDNGIADCDAMGEQGFPGYGRCA